MSPNVLALIPARVGSKGIPNKNFRPIVGGWSPLQLAIRAAVDARCEPVVSSDSFNLELWGDGDLVNWLYAPAPLHTDTCPMIDVVKDALDRVPGPTDQIIVLLQPSQPLRTPAHVQAAIALLQETQADSVVSVVELPPTHSPEWQCVINESGGLEFWSLDPWPGIAWRRQDLPKTYIRDGTVYAFYRQTVQRFGTIYGKHVMPLIIPAEESCSLDTMQDWAEAERRLQGR